MSHLTVKSKSSKRSQEPLGRGQPLDISALPKDGFLIESTVLRFFPVGRTTWWRGIRAGSYPRPYRLSARRVAWLAQDIHKLIQDLHPISVAS